ncbi:hypothetical protein SKAU_G00063440 [Synaphobranchus kaupii]|uniref:Uncharacterized protein n=1 Tax=Synaphobranchus kaupii TaxID=118154 RepID=A0A9Q1J8U0_SYNKA|nr:hypothetical protein SKAU_G00063440 [Synaphobranchus kaupii]
MILNDFNARLGPSDARFGYGDETNDNGTRLLELMEDYYLLATNTLFEKRRGKIWTWLSPHNTKHQSKTKRKETTKREKYNWKQLEDNLELQERYAVEIRNRFQLLDRGGRQQLNGTNVRANKEAAEVCLEKIPKEKKRVRSSDPRVVKAREEMATAYNTFVVNCSYTSRQVYAEKKTALFKTYNAVEEEHLAQKVKEVEAAHVNQQHATSWQLINEISGRRSAQATQIKGESDEQRVEAWYNHFNNLLGNPLTVLDENKEIGKVLTDLAIDDCPFTQAEYMKAKSSLKSGKSCGADGVVPEVLKYAPVDNIILDFIN